MKKQLAAGLLSGILAMAFAVAIHAGEKKGCDKSAGGDQAWARKCKVKCNANVEVTNTDDGVVVKMTATDPEDVKKIQECWAKRAASKAARSDGSEKAAAACLCGGCAKTAKPEPEKVTKTEQTPAACGSTKKGGTCPSRKAE